MIFLKSKDYSRDRRKKNQKGGLVLEKKDDLE